MIDKTNLQINWLLDGAILMKPPSSATLRFLINVLDQISVLVGNFVKINKHTGTNNYTGAKLLAQNYNFIWIKAMCKCAKSLIVHRK